MGSQIRIKAGERKQFQKERDFWIMDIRNVENCNNGAGDSMQLIIYHCCTWSCYPELGDHKLAVELHKKAAGMDIPIQGGHPVAMIVHLAYHCEQGNGTKQDNAKAFHWYSRLLAHECPGEENVQPAFVQGLARLVVYKKDGFMGVVVENKSPELAEKYTMFTQSNSSTQYKIAHLERWWEDYLKKKKEGV
mmetsp:Transcript_13340/g.25036  ORF Transcript_13340/g.25036 Transcript_13340/m.25036 type:complete len:191 (+) Transcript_13340:245-817(+)